MTTVGLAGLIGLLGAVVGTSGSLEVTERQIVAQREEGRAEFLRAERRDAYGKVIAIDAELETMYRDVQVFDDSYNLAAGKPAFPVTVEQVRAKVYELRAADARIRLIGSAAVAKQSFELLEAHERCHSLVIVVATFGEPSADDDTTTKEIRSKEPEAIGEVYEAREMFMTVARSELADDFEVPVEALIDADKKGKNYSERDEQK